MTREVAGRAAEGGGTSTSTVDFDLGELPRPTERARSMPREPISVRLRSWRARRTPPWRALAIVLVVAAVAGFAGWHLGGERARSAEEREISAHPGVVAWTVDTGPDLASSRDDPRADVELHLLNVGRDTVMIRSIDASTDGAPVSVDLNGYVPRKVGPNGTTIASLVLRTSCSTEYAKGALRLQLTRFDARGDGYPMQLSASDQGTLGSSLPEILNGLCHNPTRDRGSGVDGLDIDQTAGVSGATLTLTNTSDQPRLVTVTSDESPAFQLVSSKVGPQLMAAGETLEIRLKVHIITCNAIVGLQDWASTITLLVGRRGVTGDAAGNDSLGSGFPLPDLMLVPGGAAIQQSCGP